jgi:sugar lactone lactonase YvrE
MIVKTTEMQPDVVVEYSCLLGEGPVWDAKRKTICWIDILKGEIHEYSPEQKTHRIIQVHQMIGSIAVCSNGNFLAALQNGFGFIDRTSGEVRMIADPEAHLPKNRFNEGKCDPEGRFFAGTMSLSEDPQAGNLYVLENNFSVAKKIEGVTISNGMAWSSDHKTFYYTDTPTFEIAAYDYDKSTGNINNKRIIIKIPKEDGCPDGMTIDNEGMLWIAHWDGWQITRWNPDTGEKLYHIPLPVSRVTSCAFGGNNLNNLYITSASTGLTADELQKQPLAGSLFVVRNSGFKGMSAFEFEYK